jgi:predicted nucleic acid-binding protein
VLAYASNQAAPQHADSRDVVERALDGRLEAVLVPQVLLEFHAVVTDARRFERPLAAEEAWAQIQALTAGIRTLDAASSAFDEMPDLVRRHRPVGGDVFDLFLVAQMRAHGIEVICTEDVKGFERFAADGITAVRPSDAASEPT